MSAQMSKVHHLFGINVTYFPPLSLYYLRTIIFLQYTLLYTLMIKNLTPVSGMLSLFYYGHALPVPRGHLDDLGLESPSGQNERVPVDPLDPVLEGQLVLGVLVVVKHSRHPDGVGQRALAQMAQQDQGKQGQQQRRHGLRRHCYLGRRMFVFYDWSWLITASSNFQTRLYVESISKFYKNWV